VLFYTVFNGPNAPIANGSLIPAMEKEGDYMIQMIQKMIREDIRSMCVKKQAEADFTAYTDAWMPRSICKRSLLLPSYLVLSLISPAT
jgi:hypothetical protein